jgi:hypothetical protein
MTKKNQDFTMFAGDTMDIPVTVATKNLTGATINWVLKKTINGANAAAFLRYGWNVQTP